MNITVETRDKERGGWRSDRYSRRGGYYVRSEVNDKTRVYVFAGGEGVFENLANRFSRPVELYRAAMRQALDEKGLTAKARWSQKAGCSCGCSPAFITDQRLGYDIFVTINEADQAAKVDPAKAYIAEDRTAQILADPTLPFAAKEN